MCLVVGSFNSCKNPTDLGGNVIETQQPPPPFKVQVLRIEGYGNHIINGQRKTWEIEGKRCILDSAKIDTSGKRPYIWLSGQCFTSVSKLIPKELNAALQNVNFRIDSLPLSENGRDITTNPRSGSGAIFVIKKSIIPQNGKDRDTLSVATTLDPNNVTGLVSARFVERPFNPALAFVHQYILEISFSINVELEREKLVIDLYPINGRISLFINY